MVKKIIVLSRSEEKVAEVKELLEKIGIEVVSVKDCGLDMTVIYEQLKSVGSLTALEVANLTGECCICDDVIVNIHALNGKPGSVANLLQDEGYLEIAKDKIIAELQSQPDLNWNARMMCILTFARPAAEGEKKQETQMFIGDVCGKIVPYKANVKGHDLENIFSPNGFGQTLAQFQLAEKNEISHIGDALRQLMAYLERE